LNPINSSSTEFRPFRLTIQGKIGGPHPEGRTLFELISAWIDLQVNVAIESTENITGPVSEDPRQFLLAQFSGIPVQPLADCRIVSGSKPPKPESAQRLVWIPNPPAAIANPPKNVEIWCNPQLAWKYRSKRLAPLPLGINPIRFHPGVTPFPLPLPPGSFIFFYHGPLDDGAYQSLLNTCRSSLKNGLYYWVVNDYGFEADGTVPESLPVSQGVFRIHGIRNERQLAGLYAAANCLIDPRPFDALEKYQALACGVPVLTPAPIKLPNEEWIPPHFFNAEKLDEILKQIIADIDKWQIKAAQACQKVHAGMNWHQVAARLLTEGA
jgi:hypothetical protein